MLDNLDYATVVDAETWRAVRTRRAEQLLHQLDETEEQEWDGLLATPNSQQFLERMAAEAREAVARGEVRELDEDL